MGNFLPGPTLSQVRVAGDEVFVVETDKGLLVMPFDPDFEEAMEIYKRGAKKFRNAMLLESVLDRPRNRFAHAETDLSVLAAAYAFGIARNHAFVDGNKRTAFQAMYLFLGLNGHDIEAPEPEVVDVMMRLAAGKLTEAAFADWIRTHLS